MRLIVKGAEPICLTQLKEVDGSVYADLQGACREIVLNELKNEQATLCAYCEKKILITIFIEHYLPQSNHAGNQLDYSNFLGVCSGKYYLDKMTGKKIDYCSNSRGNISLRLNPTHPMHMNSLSYDESNKIVSSNPVLNNELNNVLNLNFNELCEDRQEAFDNALNSVMELGLEMGLSKVEVLVKLRRSLQNGSYEFIGFLTYRIDRLMEHIEGLFN